MDAKTSHAGASPLESAGARAHHSAHPGGRGRDIMPDFGGALRHPQHDELTLQQRLVLPCVSHLSDRNVPPNPHNLQLQRSAAIRQRVNVQLDLCREGQTWADGRVKHHRSQLAIVQSAPAAEQAWRAHEAPRLFSVCTGLEDMMA